MVRLYDREMEGGGINDVQAKAIDEVIEEVHMQLLIDSSSSPPFLSHSDPTLFPVHVFILSIPGKSEMLLGEFIREYPGSKKTRSSIHVATKFAAYPWRGVEHMSSWFWKFGREGVREDCFTDILNLIDSS